MKLDNVASASYQAYPNSEDEMDASSSEYGESSGQNQLYNLVSSDTPPIHEITDTATLDGIVGQFQQSVEDYTSGGPSEGAQNPSTPAGDWKYQSNNAEIVAGDLLEGHETDPDNLHAFHYDAGLGQTAGLMALQHQSNDPDNEGHTVIEQLTTHPGTKYTGLSMLEKAANESQKNGNQGRLVLTPMPGRAEKFYQNSGFKTTKMDGDMVTQMKLDPANSDMWESHGNNKWRLKSADTNEAAAQQAGTSQPERVVKYYSLKPGTAPVSAAGKESNQPSAMQSGRAESAPTANLKRPYEKDSSSEDEPLRTKRRD